MRILKYLILLISPYYFFAQTGASTNTVAADYSLTINNDFACENSPSLSLDPNNVDKGDFIIYPNPVKNGICSIVFPSDKYDEASISLINLSGKTIFTNSSLKQGSKIDLSKISSGVYIGVITSNKKTTILKLIKE